MGNAAAEGKARGGWFLGHFLDPSEPLLCTDAVELKYAAHPAGTSNPGGWAANRTATTVSILIRGGPFRIAFPDRVARLEQPGDYALWPPGLPHNWEVLGDSEVLTVRWPSVSGDSVPVPDPI